MELQESLNFIKPKIMAFARTRAARFDQIELRVMNQIYKEIYGENLNMYCSPCVIKCADKIYNYMTKGLQKNIVTENSDLENMKMPELRKLANTMGVKITVKKKDLIYNIENNVEA